MLASGVTLAWSEHRYSVFKGWVGCVWVSYQLTEGAKRNFGSVLSKGKVKRSACNMNFKTSLSVASQSAFNMNFNTSLTMASQSCLLIFFDGQSKGSFNLIIHLWLGVGTHWNVVPFPWPLLAAYFCTGHNTPHHTWSCWVAPRAWIRSRKTAKAKGYSCISPGFNSSVLSTVDSVESWEPPIERYLIGLSTCFSGWL